MTGGLIILSLAYAALLLLVVSIWLHSRQSAWLKSTVSVLVFALCVTAWQGWQQVTGWPSTAFVPEQFLLLSAWVREPDDDSDPDGGIDLWVVAVHEEGPAMHPRSYQLPYDAQLHRSVEAAQRRLGQGRMQMGRRTIEDGMRTSRSGIRLAPGTLRIEFFDVPDPALPEK